MAAKQISSNLITIFLLSLSGLVAWNVELIATFGWRGNSWPFRQIYSPYVAALFAVLSYLTPLFRSQKLKFKDILLSTSSLYIISVLAYHAGKHLCFRQFSRFGFFYPIEEFLVLGFSVFFITSITYWFVTYKLIQKKEWKSIFTILLFTTSSIPLSIASIHVIGKENWFDSVKYGHPVFWIILMLGLSGFWINQNNQNPILNSRSKW